MKSVQSPKSEEEIESIERQDVHKSPLIAANEVIITEQKSEKFPLNIN